MSEFAGLAHDIGHPPFGHAAEDELQDIMESHDLDSFEGNAQGFRILTRPTGHYRDDASRLDFTRGGLQAVLKYPWLREPCHKKAGKKWGAYRVDREMFEWCCGPAAPLGSWSSVGDLPPRSMEAEIMDWADDITYAVHDLEDFARLGVIPIADLLSEGETLIRFSAWLTKKWESKGNANAIEALDEALGCMKKHLPVRSFKRSSERDVALSLFTARMVHECIKGTSLEFRDSVHPWAMRRPDRLNLAVEAMKELAWYFVIDGAEVRPSQVGQRIMIRTVFEYFYGEARRIASGLSHAHLPRSTRISAEITRNSGLDISPARIACDAICDLNEMQTSRLYNRLTGATIGQSDIFGESQEAASYPAIWGANPGR